MDDFSLNANFHRELQHILDAVDLSLDQRLERLAGLLNRLEPALLEQAAAWADEEIERAFVEFVASAGTDQGTPPRETRLLNALIGAAESQRRAHRAGLTTLQYARLMRVRRELGDA